jgi:hypothetical protein
MCGAFRPRGDASAAARLRRPSGRDDNRATARLSSRPRGVLCEFDSGPPDRAYRCAGWTIGPTPGPGEHRDGGLRRGRDPRATIAAKEYLVNRISYPLGIWQVLFGIWYSARSPRLPRLCASLRAQRSNLRPSELGLFFRAPSFLAEKPRELALFGALGAEIARLQRQPLPRPKSSIIHHQCRGRLGRDWVCFAHRAHHWGTLLPAPPGLTAFSTIETRISSAVLCFLSGQHSTIFCVSRPTRAQSHFAAAKHLQSTTQPPFVNEISRRDRAVAPIQAKVYEAGYEEPPRGKPHPVAKRHTSLW